MLTFYGYDKCGTCRKARKWLDEHGIAYQAIDITQQPPPAQLLKDILDAGEYGLTDLFNKSGEQYRALDMKNRLPGMSDTEAMELLSQNGRLCKRPIVTNAPGSPGKHTVGFDAERFAETWR